MGKIIKEQKKDKKQNKEVTQKKVTQKEVTQKEVAKEQKQQKKHQVLEKSKKIKKQQSNNDQNVIQKKNDKKVDKKQNKKMNKIQDKKQDSKQQIENEQKIFNNYEQYISVKEKQIQNLRVEIQEQISLDKNQIKQAVKSLVQYHLSKKNVSNLLDTSSEDFIYIEISLKKLPEKYSIRPIQIKLKHPIYTQEYNSQFCLFVQDPQRDFKDKIQDLDVNCIAKVQGYGKLIKKYPTFLDKRKLCQDYDLFFCDYRIYDLLNKHTGKYFYQRKKIPYPIDFIQNDPQKLQKQLNSLQNYSYFIFGNGPVYTLKVARVGMNQEQILENIIEGFYQLIPYILCENITTSSVEQISIKTFNSISLPFYNYLSGKEIKAFKE